MKSAMPTDVFHLAPRVIVAAATTGHPGYDFDFRTFLDVRSVYSADVSDRMLVRIGAIEDYGDVEALAADVGCSLVNGRSAHAKVN
jgi:hypothetical protein